MRIEELLVLPFTLLWELLSRLLLVATPGRCWSWPEG